MAEQSQNPGTVTNTFTKGMVKDLNETFQPEGMWTHARNAVNNSHEGQMGVIGNEPANLKCVQLPYTLIGIIGLGEGEWAVFTTDDTNSEIGIFNELKCTYTKVVNDACLSFKRSHLITGVSRNRFDCETVLYWDDGLNPSRYMDVDKPPFKYTDKIIDGCITRTYTTQLDCEKIRLAPLLSHPCLELSKGKGAGTLANGSYQVCMAYTINQNRISDYIGLSNIQSVFSHQNLGGALEIKVQSVDLDFDEFELVIISTINAQTVAKRLGYYNTTQGTIYVDTISPELTTVPLSFVSLRTEPVEKSDAMYQVNNYLLRIGTYSNFQFNYQKQANGIRTKWQAVQYPANFYYKGGNNASYLRDEQYSFFIRWIYNTGSRSASFHIPGRSSFLDELTPVLGGDAFETADPESGEQKKLWQIQNTATIDNLTTKPLKDGGIVIASGKMAYWESTERYPADRPDIWGDLCGKPIRHHKFPDETVDEILNHYNTDGQNIVLMGVSFENITHPLDNTGKPITSIVGYEILRGSREGQKSIIAKGLMNNMREYNIPGNTTVEGLYQNYPYNDLNADYYLTSDQAILDPKLKKTVDPENPDFNIDDTDDEGNIDGETRKQAKDRIKAQRNRLKEGDTSPGDVNLSFPLSKYRKDYFSFHSPDTTFTQPFLGINEVKIYQEVYGESVGKFVAPYKHPRFKTVTNFAAVFSSVISTIAAIGNTISILAQDSDITLQGTDKLPFTKKLTLTKVPNHSVAASAFGTGVTIPNPAIVAINSVIGVYNGVAAVAMTVIESQAIGEQLMNVIYGMIPRRQNALQYDSYGFYNKSRINNLDNRRFKIDNALYIGPNQHSFDTKYVINNLFRSNYVALKLDGDVANPINEDNSRFRIGEKGGAINTPYKSNISGYYGSLKVSIPSQYGQLESIKQVPISDCIHPATNPDAKYSTETLFGGDTYINRFTEKNSFFFFNSWLMGEPDEAETDYRDYVNVAYPRFWIDSNRQSFKLFSNASNFRHLDERESSVFFVSKGYFYLFNSGVRDFFVESEINLAQRDWEEDISKRHYDPNNYVDYESMFRSDIIRSGNYYKYDYSLSASRLFNNFSSWGTMLPRDYDPKIAETCYIYKPNNVVYSLPQELELKKDNWRIFLANNYKEFVSRVTSIKSVNKTGALFMMKSKSPFQFMGVDQLQTDAGTKITIGDGGLFNQPLQSIVNADDSFEYASCQNKYAVLGTTYGIFWVSQNQGKVFNYAGQINEISKDGMKWWFANYLPSELLKVYPDYPLYDNPVKGIGVQMIYDNTNEIIYISKKDYKPKRADLLFDENGFYYISGYTSVTIPGKTKTSCAPGYTLVNNECVKVDIVDPIQSGSVISVTRTPYDVYGNLGTRVYDSASTSATFTLLNTTNSFWIRQVSPGNWSSLTAAEKQAFDLNNGPVNRLAVWGVQLDSNGQPLNNYTIGSNSIPPVNQWIGFDVCININQTKTYYVAIAGDNEYRFSVDDTLVLSQTSGNVSTFNYLHIYPIQLTAGEHIIKVEGKNNGALAGFGCEIFDLDNRAPGQSVTDFLNAQTNYNNLLVVFSTRNVTQFSSNLYSCPTGYGLTNPSCNTPICKKTLKDSVITTVTDPVTKKIPNKVYIPFTNTDTWEDASWTISYDPKIKSWISFHDWKPTFVIPGKNHFMSVNTDSIWKHNERCDLFCNYYDKSYPFDIEFVSATGQSVNSVRNIEYLLETYKYHNNCRDKFHVLDANFDQALIYNSEQISGILELELKSKTNPVALLAYPQVGPTSIKINFSKEENKYRFNQFWDITRNRGEFDASINIPMFNTAANGYEYQINPQYVNYNKISLERKKFRHHINKVFLRRYNSGNLKFLFKISNQKILTSPR